MKIRLIYLISSFQSFLIFGIPFLSPFFTLGDRERYISYSNIDLSANFNRTILTDLIFNFGGKWLEIILGIISIFLHFYLVESFSQTLKVSKINKIIAIIWLLLPVHFILRSIAGKELLASLSFCILILIMYPFVFPEIIDSEEIPGFYFRKNKTLFFTTFLSFFTFLAFIRPFFLVIYFLLLIPYLYKKIPLKINSKKTIYLSLFFISILIFTTLGGAYYESIQSYIANNFVGTGDSTFTNQSIPEFDKFTEYLYFLFFNIFNAVLGPTNKLFLSNMIGPILLLEGLISLIPIILIFSRNIIYIFFKPRIRLTMGLTYSSSIILLLLIYSLLGYVNFLAGWRLQSGSWILFILLYLKISRKLT